MSYDVDPYTLSYVNDHLSLQLKVYIVKKWMNKISKIKIITLLKVCFNESRLVWVEKVLEKDYPCATLTFDPGWCYAGIAKTVLYEGINLQM